MQVTIYKTLALTIELQEYELKGWEDEPWQVAIDKSNEVLLGDWSFVCNEYAIA